MRRIIQKVNRYLFYLSTVPLFAMMMLTIIDVIGRYFGSPLPGTFEIVTICLAVICTWCWAHTQARKGHISIDLLVKAMSPRTQAITRIFTSSIALIIVGLIAWQTIPMVLYARRLMEWTNVLKLPIWPFKAMLFLGAFLLCTQLILDIVDHFRALLKQTAVKATAVSAPSPGGTGID